MIKHTRLPSKRRLDELLSYDKITGILHWKIRTLGVRKDMVAGSFSRGYLVVRIDGVLFFAHRIIWMMMMGEEPIDQIDHIDMNKSNNKWSNLRQADNSKNMMNIGLASNNKSGIKGVFWETSSGYWRGRIKLNGKSHHVGIFSTLDDAKREMQVARDRLHGKFARAS